MSQAPHTALSSGSAFDVDILCSAMQDAHPQFPNPHGAYLHPQFSYAPVAPMLYARQPRTPAPYHHQVPPLHTIIRYRLDLTASPAVDLT